MRTPLGPRQQEPIYTECSVRPSIYREVPSRTARVPSKGCLPVSASTSSSSLAFFFGRLSPFFSFLTAALGAGDELTTPDFVSDLRFCTICTDKRRVRWDDNEMLALHEPACFAPGPGSTEWTTRVTG
jgi:hypothetical protein